MAPVNTLGIFSRLPLEIREEIWNEFQPQCLQGNNQLAILSTSRQIHEEVSALIYKHQAFKIWIPARCGQKPVEDSSDSSPQPEDEFHITITNNFNHLWQLKGFQHAVSIGFGPGGFPWHKIPQLRIEIEAPWSEDGELISLYKRTKDLVELIERPGKRSKNIEILLKDTEDTQWFCRCGDPETTEVGIHMVGSQGQGEEIKNYQVILGLFHRLRNFKSAKVHTTKSSALGPEMNALFELLQNDILVEPTPFGHFKKRTRSFDMNDKETSKALGDRYLMMERFLDIEDSTLEGSSSTANCLRRERFANWYSDNLHGQSKYEDDIMKILFSGKRSLKQLQLEIFCLDHRYRMMRAYKPSSVQLWNEFTPSTKPPPAEASWDIEKWETEWPQGLGELEPVWDFVSANISDKTFRSDIDTVLGLWEKSVVPSFSSHQWRQSGHFLQAFPGVTDGSHEDFWRTNYFRDKVSERCEELENYHDLCWESMEIYGELAWPLRKEGEQLAKVMSQKEIDEWRETFKRGIR